MREELDHTRRWLINASGAAILSSAIPIDASHAQTAATTPRSAGRATSDLPEGSATDRTFISPHTAALADYVAGTLDRELPAAAAARTKLHILDTIAAMVSGSRLKPGAFAARYVDSIGGKPQAMVIGTSLLTSAVNAALANAMAAHADETDDAVPWRQPSPPGNSRGAPGTTCCARSRLAMTSAHGWSCRSTERGGTAGPR